MTPVTDPSILQQLNGPSPVTDPAILAQLNGDDSSTTSQLGAAASAFEHHVMNLPQGGAQFIENGAASLANKYLPDGGIKDAIVNNANQTNAYMAQREKDYQASTPDSSGAYAGATAGEIAPFLLDAPVKGLQYLGDAAGKLLPDALPSIFGKVGSGATQGAAIAATAPVTDNSNPYWDQKSDQVQTGAVAGGAIPVAGSALKGAFGLGRDAIAPFTNPGSIVAPALRDWAGSDPDTITALQNPQQFVNGSNPTTAQVLGGPDIIQAEKALANNPAYKGLFENRNIENNNARLAAIQNVAQTPQDLANALAARKDAASEWIGTPATDTTPAIPGKLETGNPVNVSPITAAIQKLQDSSLAERGGIGPAAKDLMDSITRLSSPDADGNKVAPIGHLDAIRQNVKDYIAKNKPNGIVSSQEVAAFVPVQNAISDAIESANPGYRNYLATFAQNSTPINTMEKAQGLYSNLANSSLNAGADPQVRFANYNSQLAKALKGPYGIDPAAKATLEGVQNDLQRATISNSLKSPGSDTSYNLQAPGWIGKKLYGDTYGGSGKLVKALLAGGGALSGGHFGPEGAITGLLAGLGGGVKLGDMAGSKVNSLLAEALLNPQKAAELIQQNPQNRQLITQLSNKFPQLGSLLLSKEASQQQ